MSLRQYVLAFIVGSSYPVMVNFYLGVQRVKDIRNYTYEDYTLIAPLYLGVVNAIGLYLSKQFPNIEPYRFLLTGLASGTFVASLAYKIKSYNFTQREWLLYCINITLRHIIMFGFVMYQIETYLNKLLNK